MRMTAGNRILYAGPAILLGLSVLASPASAQDDEIRHDMDSANKYYEQASKDFGDGSVQLHSRKEGTGGTTHTVYSFDCKKKKYDVLFSGVAEPENFPVDQTETAQTSFDENDDVAPLAQHACTKHGYPLLEW